MSTTVAETVQLLGDPAYTPPEITQPPLNIGKVISQMLEIREERRKIGARDKELVALWEAGQATLINALDAQTQTTAGTPFGTATITEEVVPQIDDWDTYYAYIKDNDAWHLLQRRPAAAAFRELHEAGEVVPGASAFVKRSISLRAKG